MMRAIPAPPGYEACVFWNDDARGWQASARPIGAIWWTNVGGPFGGTHMHQSLIDEIAAGNIERAIAFGKVK